MSKSLALFAFETLISKLESTPTTSLVEIERQTNSRTGDYPQKAPLFVTWNKKGKLRGCIGTFQSMEVEEGIAEYALISAFEDTRFAPIKSSELLLLTVSITLLDNFTEITDPEDWTIGKHGLKVLLTSQGHRYLGTFLPLVAEEQEWTLSETLWSLLRKAGFGGVPADQTIEFYNSSIAAGSLKLVRYEGLKCEATYKEYLDAASRY